MLENVDLTRNLGDDEYKKNMKILEPELGELQRKAWELKIPIILVFEGWHASGIAESINRFILPLDPRGYYYHTINAPSPSELLKPFLWRFWTKIPVRGGVAIFDRSWYSRAVTDKYRPEKSEEELDKCLDEINYFERQLTDDKYLIIKFFLHIGKKDQKERLRKLRKNDIPLIVDEYETRCDKPDFIHEYDKYLPIIEKVLKKTSFPNAPWTIVEASDQNFASAKIITTVMEAIKDQIEIVTRIPARDTIKYLDNGSPKIPELTASVLEKVDLSKCLGPEEYKEALKDYQHRLCELQYELFRKKRPLILAFEGWDAAGKGGNIRRLVKELNPRLYRVVPTGSPNDFEKAHHYLWRFLDGIPRAGHITIYDRTWYGRVMVEKIENLCSEEEWKRAYREINEFEEILANSGAIILKFWLHIDMETQLKRFKSREEDPARSWKITPEDWRNRSKWEEYGEAVDEILRRTSTSYAPWIVVEANDKRYSRMKVLKTVVEALEKELNNNDGGS
ncbi:MAG: polyphosphate:AMP phosphotransferase [Methanosarcinaceae archaeon]|nr:polyphosphate:AMP phosphotransferase [Methanosarcinaceae archaeon]